MWLVIRYDAQANSLVATGSDKDGAALWYARSVSVREVVEEGKLILNAVAVLKSGKPKTWSEWEQFSIEIDKSQSARITKTNPNGTRVYKGRAVAVHTYDIP
jgi:hypothetical protein